MIMIVELKFENSGIRRIRQIWQMFLFPIDYIEFSMINIWVWLVTTTDFILFLMYPAFSAKYNYRKVVVFFRVDFRYRAFIIQTCYSGHHLGLTRFIGGRDLFLSGRVNFVGCIWITRYEYEMCVCVCVRSFYCDPHSNARKHTAQQQLSINNKR